MTIKNTKAAGAHKHKDDSVEAGRRYVAAYVEFIHFAEHIHTLVSVGTADAGHEH